MTPVEQPRQPRPRGASESEICFALSRFGPLSLRSLHVNLPQRYLAEGDVLDSLARLEQIGLVSRDAGGIYQMNRTAAAEMARKASEEELRAYAIPVERPVFR